MDRLTALRTLILTAEHRSFAEAARRLRLSPTVVSRGIAELEQSLGVILLRRTTRSVNPTPEGAAYLERCRRALEELEAADRAVRGEQAEPRGALIVTAPVVFGRMHVLPIVTGLLSRHKALAVQLTLNDRFVRLVEEGIDVAVRIADLADSALHAVRLGEVRRVLVASPGYLAARGAPEQPAELRAHDLIAFDTLSGHHEWRFTGEGRPAVRVEPRLATDNVDAAIAAAVAGLGIARVLSYQVREHILAGRLCRILPALEPPATPVQLVFQANRRRTANVAAFIAAAQEYCRARDLG